MSESRVVSTRELRGIMLPIGSHNLLLPNAAVAELIGYQAPETDTEKPPWWLGMLPWRGARIPVVSMEKALGLVDSGSTQRARIAVINTINANPGLPYIGVLTMGISRLARVSPTTIAVDTESEVDSPLVLKAVKLGEQKAWVPDLDELERIVADAA